MKCLFLAAALIPIVETIEQKYHLYMDKPADEGYHICSWKMKEPPYAIMMKHQPIGAECYISITHEIVKPSPPPEAYTGETDE